MKNRNILVCVSGGIAAYKACDIVSLLTKYGCSVKVVMTENATKFVTPLSFETLSHNKVWLQPFDNATVHIDLARWANVVLVVPATANTVGKIACGFADNLLTTTILASSCPIVIAPAMNTQMYNNSIYQQNQDKLINLGYRFVLPQSGVLACGDVGIGKLAPVDVIVQSVLDCLNLTTKLDNSSGFNQDLDILKNDSLNIDKTLSNKEKKNFNLISHEQEELYNNDFSPSYESMQCDDIVKKDLKNKTVLITAGATIQNIDPVRYISNHSSGKMGLALAERVYKRGGNVILVAGNISLPIPKHYYHIKAETSREMHDAVMAQILNVDYFIMAAAPADYEAINYSDQKIKSPEIVLSFKKTIDIAKAVGQSKMSHQKLVIFSAESQNLLENARIKLMLKNADLVVANDITQKGAGFNVDTNIVTIISRENEIELPCLPKIDVADRILDILVSYT